MNNGHWPTLCTTRPRINCSLPIHLFWKEYQANLLSQLNDLGRLIIAGDGCHDSMGHCAKYCAYTVFCCTLPRIIHFALVQRNQAGSSPGMEFLGFQTCMNFHIGCAVVIRTYISDRHVQIASHMKNVLKNITHYFDIWHLKKNYVEERFQFFLGLSKEQLQDAVQDLKAMTPEPMNSMLVDKQPRAPFHVTSYLTELCVFW
ncbi:uncharacterized protein [Montipora foliosa]|uniref:uncharacterized protein n=1 Tax=Montipora foliosa TaxID=591990 RepID=UPI0035F1B688